MESNCVQGKIFVGGISAETSEEILTQHFSHYGEVVKSQIIKFRDTNIGKGFGFVTFADSSVIHQLLQQQHIIVGRTVDVKLAITKGESRQCQRCSECQQFQRQNSEISRRKIFVGGLPPSLSEDDFEKYFEKFGRIEEVRIIFNRVTKTPRGFGFVTYDSEESVTKVLQEKFHWLKNKSVEVKKAEPREWRFMNTNNNYYHNFYPINEMWQIYDGNNGIYAPHHTMVPSWTSPFNHLGTNIWTVPPQPVPIMAPYFMPRCPINCYASMHNQVDYEVSSTSAHNSCGTGYQNDVINERNSQDCNNIEVQLVANGSLPANESEKPLEKETDNGEKDHLEKIPQVNTKANNDDMMKIFQINTDEDVQGINGVARCI